MQKDPSQNDQITDTNNLNSAPLTPPVADNPVNANSFGANIGQSVSDNTTMQPQNSEGTNVNIGVTTNQPTTPTQLADNNQINPTVIPVAPKKGKKKLILLISVILAIVVIGGAGVGAYFWYQNPQKVITDSLIHAVTSKMTIYDGNISVDSKDTKIAVKLSAKQADMAKGSFDASVAITYSGESYSAKAAAIYDANGDVYFKVQDIKSLVEKLKASYGLDASNSETTAAMDKIVKKIDGTWIKVSNDDLKKFSESYAKTQTCIKDTVKKLSGDSKVVSEVSDLYQQNQFIVVDKELGQKYGDFGYKIKGDEAKAKSFAKGFVNIAVYKTLHDCDNSFAINADDISLSSAGSDNVSAELWVDMWSHQISKFILSGKSDDTSISATITPTFNQKVEITAPTNSMSLSEVQNLIVEFTSSMYSSANYGITND